jgi:hypothetical protein
LPSSNHYRCILLGGLGCILPDGFASKTLQS